MSNKEIKRIVTITFLISILCMPLLEVIKIDISTISGIKSALSFSTIVSIWWTLYFKYGWKWAYFNKILYKENINGTWFGIYSSVGVDYKKYTGDISLVIKQDYLKIDITSYTEKYETYSYDEKLLYNDKRESYQLIYVYSQEESGIDDTNIRKGISELKLIKYGKELNLEGKFWTNSKTVGELKLTKVSEEHIPIFKKAQRLYKEMLI